MSQNFFILNKTISIIDITTRIVSNRATIVEINIIHL